MIICRERKICEFLCLQSHRFSIRTIHRGYRREMISSKKTLVKNIDMKRRRKRDPRRTKKMDVDLYICVFLIVDTATHTYVTFALMCLNRSEDTTRSCSLFCSSRFPCDTTRLRLYVLSWLWKFAHLCLCMCSSYVVSRSVEIMQLSPKTLSHDLKEDRGTFSYVDHFCPDHHGTSRKQMSVCTKIDRLWRVISEKVTQKNTCFWSWRMKTSSMRKEMTKKKNKDDEDLSQRYF